ncbi:MAG: DUF1622 domain-containing protein [Christensenellales bacterium]|jgi:uncharacterized membrane protein
MGEIIHNIFNQFVQYTIYGLEAMGVVVILIASVRAFCRYIRNLRNSKSDSAITRLAFAKSLALGLEFKLGGEILRTVMVRDWQEIGIVAAIIALRALLNFIIHVEIKNMESHYPNPKVPE